MCPVNLLSLLTGEDSGGTWTYTSGSTPAAFFNLGNPTSVDFTGANLGSHVFTYTVGDPSGCGDSETVTVNVVAGANAGTDSSVSMCTSDANTGFVIFGNPDANGTFTGTVPSGVIVTNQPQVPGFIVNPNGTYTGSFTLTYTVTTPGSPAGCSNCTDTSTHTVTIVSAPNAGTGSSITVCA